ncbi:hypothetical protein V5799_006963 [Amblyomma americanum]|uniref:DDE Tnp4 domain-containing protein n=1 Tax=Amblyomma americanum TaxID=6943 RepID=A0AAQ4DUW6_AMBAM
MRRALFVTESARAYGTEKAATASLVGPALSPIAGSGRARKSPSTAASGARRGVLQRLSPDSAPNIRHTPGSGTKFHNCTRHQGFRSAIPAADRLAMTIRWRQTSKRSGRCRTVLVPSMESTCLWNAPQTREALIITTKDHSASHCFLSVMRTAALHEPALQANYERRIFNYRLSRARRIIENAFGILAQKWRILRRPFNAKPININRYVGASLVLHNYLLKESAESSSMYCPPRSADAEDWEGRLSPGSWRDDDSSLAFSAQRLTGCNATRHAKQVRDKLTPHFVMEVTEGVPLNVAARRLRQWFHKPLDCLRGAAMPEIKD